MRHGHPGPLPAPAFTRYSCQSASPQHWELSGLGVGDWHLWFGVFLWHLALSPSHPLTLHPLTLAKMADVKRLIRAQRSQGSGLSV